MKYLVVFMSVMFLGVSNASAGDSAFKYGIGIFGSAEKSHAEVKSATFSYQSQLFQALIQQYEVGFYTDTREDVGRRPSGLGFYSLGLNIEPGALFFQSLWGVGMITTPDSMLGGMFQFTQDLLVGVKDSHGYSIGLDYKHISSAGLYNPNHGRDFIMIRLGVPF